jgi:uncharacterized protein YndB with AHSA1/START domain
MAERSEELQSLSITRVFPNPPNIVFDAWTNPEHLKNWWRITEGWAANIVSVDLRRGGAFRLGLKALAGGETHIVNGIYHEIIPPRKLVFSFNVEGEKTSQTEELVTIEFHDFHGDTRMELTHTRIRRGEPRVVRENGWEATLGSLGAYLSRKS